MTIAAVLIAVLLLVAVSLTTALERLANDVGPTLAFSVKLAGWSIAIVAASGLVSALYRMAPSSADAKWRWVTPGSILSTLGIAVASAGFGWYASRLGNYNATYGSLGAVVVLLLWLWLSAYVLLLGGELNAELEHQTERDSTTGAEMPLGQRAATMADVVAPDG